MCIFLDLNCSYKIQSTNIFSTHLEVMQPILVTRDYFRHSLALSYLSDLIVKTPFLGLRSDNQLELVVSRTHLVIYGEKAFSTAAANLWNSISVAIRLCNTVTIFKICIKTYMFNLTYPINQWIYQTRNIYCWQVLLNKVMVVVMCFYPNFILCVLFIVQRFWILQKKRYINLTLHYSFIYRNDEIIS